MASQALYRRYRSQTFSELIGQEHIVQTLRNALADGRTAHAYLFTGPRGVGKTSVARLLAKAVNCTADGERPCGACAMCVAVAEGSAVDVIEMDAASHTSVDDAREIIERVQFRPTTGNYKVYIIDEVHMLSTAAFNALLKTLEEPPGHALFILATTEAHKIPATILSRCQRFTFSRHTVAATATHLHQVAAQEQFTLEAGVAETLARSATGSMRDALGVLDQLMAYGSTTITLAQVQNLIGATEDQEVVALVDALIRADMAAGLRAVAGVADQGADLRQFSRDVVERLRALMLLKAGGDPSLLDVTDDELGMLDEQARAGSVADFLAWVKLFSGLDVQLRASAIPQLPLEMAVVEALTVPMADDGRRTTVKDDGRTAGTVQRPAPPRSPAPSKVAETPRRGVSDATKTPHRGVSTNTNAAADFIHTEDAAPKAHVVADAENATQHPDLISSDATETPQRGVATDAASPEVINDDLSVPTASVEPIEVLSDEDARAIAAANAAVDVLEYIEVNWQQILRDIRVVNPAAEALLKSGAHPVDVDENTVVLEFKFPKHVEMLERRGTRMVVEDSISKHLGGTYTVRGVVQDQINNSEKRLQDKIRENRKDKLVKAAVNIFGADIVAVEYDQQGE